MRTRITKENGMWQITLPDRSTLEQRLAGLEGIRWDDYAPLLEHADETLYAYGIAWMLVSSSTIRIIHMDPRIPHYENIRAQELSLTAIQVRRMVPGLVPYSWLRPFSLWRTWRFRKEIYRILDQSVATDYKPGSL